MFNSFRLVVVRYLVVSLCQEPAFRAQIALSKRISNLGECTEARTRGTLGWISCCYTSMYIIYIHIYVSYTRETFTNLYIFIVIRVYLFIYIYIYIYICIYVYMYICIYVYKYVSVCTYVYAYVFVCIYIYMLHQRQRVS